VPHFNSSNTIPDILAPDKSRKQWVARNGSKIPFRTDFRKADVTNPDDWSTYDQITAAIAGKPDLGYGFVITPPYVGIDLDTYKTTDPTIIDIHKRIHDELFANTYSELSPHGGVHILCQGSIPDDVRHNIGELYVEIYDDDRYFTYTGNAINLLPVINCQQSLDTFCQWIDKHYPPHTPTTVNIINGPPRLSDDELLNTASNAFNGELFRTLWDGYWQSKYASHSEADCALVDILAFYSDNVEQIVRLFHRSQLGRRKKAYRNDYLYSPKYGLITKAFDQKPPVLDLTKLEEQFERIRAGASAPAVTHNGAMPHTHQVVPTIPLVSPPATTAVDPIQPITPDSSDLPYPPGLVGDIAQFICSAAHYPNKRVAIAASIAFFAGLTGRAYNINGTGLNQYIVLLGESGIGKESGRHGISKLCDALRTSKDVVRNYIGPAVIASAPALLRCLPGKPSMCVFKGEMGIWLQSLTKPDVKQNELQLKGILLDLFNKSGQGDTFDGSAYADTDKNIKLVKAPAFTMYGESTPGNFYKAVDHTNIEEGLISRLTVIACPNVRPSYNEDASNATPPEALLTALEKLIPRVCFLNQDGTPPMLVDETPEATAFQREYRKCCQDKQWKDNSKPENQIWSRAHLRVLRLGALVAVGVNPVCPIVQIPHYQWAQKLIEDGISAVIKRYESGDVGHTTLGFKQRQAVEKLLREYVTEIWTQDFGDTYRITEIMHKCNVIPRTYIINRLFKTSVFTKDNDATRAFKNAVDSFVSSGALEVYDLKNIERNSRGAVVYKIIAENLPTG